MSPLLWIIGATILVSLISFIGVVTLSVKRSLLKGAVFVFVAFAAGSLIGVSIFDLLPEALEIGSNLASIYIVVGILVFFVVERFVGWHHSHHPEDIDPQGHKEHHHDHTKPFVYVILASEAVHNFIDGTLIAASFLTSPVLGIASTIAVALHEIPQEIGDFAVLVHGGLTAKKALFYNFVVATTAVAGGIITFFLSGIIQNITPVLLGIAAGGFLYLAMVDLLPEINKEKSLKKSGIQFVFLVVGLALTYVLATILHI